MVLSKDEDVVPKLGAFGYAIVKHLDQTVIVSLSVVGVNAKTCHKRAEIRQDATEPKYKRPVA